MMKNTNHCVCLFHSPINVNYKQMATQRSPTECESLTAGYRQPHSGPAELQLS